MRRTVVSPRLILALCVCALGVSTGCATTDDLLIPASEIEQLLAQPPSAAGLTPDQSSAMLSIVETTAAERQTLDLHLEEEREHLQRLLAGPRAFDSPEVWAQISLVSQLRANRLLMAALLREELWKELTHEQQMWWVKNRLNVMLPME
ncbi:MAG TPA: hypothetical protein VEI24_02245 [Nitrospiria bacterium]|nr:hypothetical protein [Nitrospiria bacterium]